MQALKPETAAEEDLCASSRNSSPSFPEALMGKDTQAELQHVCVKLGFLPLLLSPSQKRHDSKECAAFPLFSRNGILFWEVKAWCKRKKTHWPPYQQVREGGEFSLQASFPACMSGRQKSAKCLLLLL